MPSMTVKSAALGDFNRSIGLVYVLATAALFLVGLGYLLYNGKYFHLAVIFALPLLLVFVTQPKYALMQYIFMLFISRSAFGTGPLLVTDLSGFIVIFSALLDFMLSKDQFYDLPKLSFNFLSLLSVTFLTGIFSLNPVAAVRPFGRIVLLFAIFLALYRLSKKVSPAYCINLYFIFAVLNSVLVMIPFVLSKGALRSFGLAPVIFDELALLALVIGVAKFIWSEKGQQLFYLGGSLLVFLALLSTQSRAPILFGLIMTVTIIVLSASRVRQLLKDKYLAATEIPFLKTVMRRPKRVIISAIISLLVTIMVFPGLFTPLIERFDELWTYFPSKSFLLRTVLWKTAFNTFLLHPILGVGPGLFPNLDFYYQEVRLNFLHSYVRGLSAHNMLLHYMAEMGIVGAAALLALMVNLTRWGRRLWMKAAAVGEQRLGIIMYALAITFLLTTIFEAGWLWGQTGLIFTFFAAVIVRSA